MSNSVTPWTVACQAPMSMGFSRQNTGVGSHSLLLELFPTHGLNPGLPHCRWSLYCLSHHLTHKCREILFVYIHCPYELWGLFIYIYKYILLIYKYLFIFKYTYLQVYLFHLYISIYLSSVLYRNFIYLPRFICISLHVHI